MDQDKFNMWRTIFSTVYLDQKIDSKEQEWVDQKVLNLGLDQEQLEVLKNDFSSKTSTNELFELVREPKNKSILIHLMRVVAHIDGDYSSEEQKSLEEIKKMSMKNIDIEEVKSKLKFEVIDERQGVLEKLFSWLSD